MKLEDEEWELFHGFIWIASLKIRIRNATLDNRVIGLRKFSLENDVNIEERNKPTQEQATAVVHEIIRRSDSYSTHIRAMDLEPDDSMSGWYVDWVSSVCGWRSADVQVYRDGCSW
jgi:hypothetical protein